MSVSFVNSVLEGNREGQTNSVPAQYGVFVSQRLDEILASTEDAIQSLAFAESTSVWRQQEMMILVILSDARYISYNWDIQLL